MLLPERNIYLFKIVNVAMEPTTTGGKRYRIFARAVEWPEEYEPAIDGIALDGRGKWPSITKLRGLGYAGKIEDLKTEDLMGKMFYARVDRSGRWAKYSHFTHAEYGAHMGYWTLADRPEGVAVPPSAV